MEQYLNYYMEDEATTSAGDIGEFTPQMGKKAKRESLGKKVDVRPSPEERGKMKKAFSKKKDTKKDKKKLSEQQLKEDPNMIEETTNYKFYNEGDKKVFEILDEQDFNMFYQGLRKANNRIWRQGETCTKMLEHMMQNRGLWFEVRFGDRTYKPFDKGR